MAKRDERVKRQIEEACYKHNRKTATQMAGFWWEEWKRSGVLPKFIEDYIISQKEVATSV